MGKDSRSRNLDHFLFPRRIMVLQTSSGFQSKTLPPCPYLSGTHPLNTFQHKTFCLGRYPVRVPGSFPCFTSHTFLDFSLLPPALFNIGLVCLVLVWTIRMKWLCVLRQAHRTDDLEMSNVKKSYPALFASDFKKEQNAVLLTSTSLRKGRVLCWSVLGPFSELQELLHLYPGVSLHYAPIKHLKKGCPPQGFLNTIFRLTEHADRTLK